MDSIVGVCLAEKSKDPIAIIKKLMALPFFGGRKAPMHGPEHHVMVGSALLAAYKNAGGKTVYNTGDAAKGFSGIYGIATDNEESIFHIANGTIAVNGEALIEIIDLNGRKVASAYCDSFSTETLPKGMYIIRATTQSTTQTHKVIVK